MRLVAIQNLKTTRVAVVAVRGKDMKTFKILGLFLSYPRAEIIEALPECLAILEAEKWISSQSLKDIKKLTVALSDTDLLDLQEEYVALFDRTPSLSLHLFEHVHGDSRDRGPAMVDLGNLYREKRLEIAIDELPDYLPLFFEYLSVLSEAEAKEGLDGVAHIIVAIGARLKQRESLYAGVIDAALSTAKRKPDSKAVERALAAASGEMPNSEEVDKAWEDQFALSAPDPTAQQDCPKASAMLARMNQMIERAQ
jgi:nitrate reductase delta subunit